MFLTSKQNNSLKVINGIIYILRFILYGINIDVVRYLYMILCSFAIFPVFITRLHGERKRKASRCKSFTHAFLYIYAYAYVYAYHKIKSLYFTSNKSQNINFTPKRNQTTKVPRS